MQLESTSDTRSPERIKMHYEIERELAARLMRAPRSERTKLYTAVYDEMCRRVPDHPIFTRRASATQRSQNIEIQMQFLGRFVFADAMFAEIGPGDCALSIHVAGIVRKVFGVDVSAEITKDIELPANMRIIISDGVSIPVPPGSLDVVYSHQLMEHLHPEDAFEQLRSIWTALKPDGVYVCVTPSRLTGPHDISAQFDEISRGFHLKEYTFSELADIAGRAGFSTVRSFIGGKGVYHAVPLAILWAMERHYSSMEVGRRRSLRRDLPLRLLSTIRIVARK